MYTSSKGIKNIAGDTCIKCDGTGEFRAARTNRLVGRCFACNGTGHIQFEEREVETGAASKRSRIIEAIDLLSVLRTAKLKGAKPSIRLDGFKFTLADKDSTGSTIYVRSEDNEYLGKWVGGRFTSYSQMTLEELNHLEKVMGQDEEGLLDATIRYARQTGICGCCGRTLTNKDSIKLGIGPICADKFGFIDRLSIPDDLDWTLVDEDGEMGPGEEPVNVDVESIGKALTGTVCSVCRKPQWESPAGVTCAEGHGGAESLEAPAPEEPAPEAIIQAAPEPEPTQAFSVFANLKRRG